MEAVLAAVELDEEDGRSVRIPVADLGEVAPWHVQIDERAGSRAPDRGGPLAATLVTDGEAIVAGEGGPGERHDLAALVLEVGDDGSGPGIQHAKGAMDEVAVLTVLDRHERLVGVHGRQVRTPTDHRVAAAEEDRVPAAAKLAGRPVELRHVDREAVAIGNARHGPGSPRGEASVPARRKPLRERLGRTADERCRHPGSRLVAGRVTVPQDPLSIRADLARDEPDGLMRDLPPLAGREIPGVQLVDAALRRRIDEVIRRVPRPGGKADDRRAIAALPERRRVSHGLGSSGNRPRAGARALNGVLPAPRLAVRRRQARRPPAAVGRHGRRR